MSLRARRQRRTQREPLRPLPQLTKPSGPRPDRPLADQLSRGSIDRRGGVGVLMRVHPDYDHHDPPHPLTLGGSPADSTTSGRLATLLTSQAGHPRTRRATRLAVSQPQNGDRQEWSQPAAPRLPPPPDTTRQPHPGRRCKSVPEIWVAKRSCGWSIAKAVPSNEAADAGGGLTRLDRESVRYGCGQGALALVERKQSCRHAGGDAWKSSPATVWSGWPETPACPTEAALSSCRWALPGGLDVGWARPQGLSGRGIDSG